MIGINNWYLFVQFTVSDVDTLCDISAFDVYVLCNVIRFSLNCYTASVMTCTLCMVYNSAHCISVHNVHECTGYNSAQCTQVHSVHWCTVHISNVINLIFLLLARCS